MDPTTQGARAESSDQAVSEFLLRACHDLRAALRAMRAHSELMQRNPAAAGDEDLTQSLGFVVGGAKKLDELIGAMASYGIALRIESSSFLPVKMDAILRVVLRKLERELHECNAEVVCAELPAISGNPDRLMQVWEHLIRNAVVHRGDAPPRIEVGAERDDDAWRFAVSDNGPGVDASALEKIFLPFERLTRREGSGLGLTVCRAIIERHGGRIWAESPPGKGATIHFTLPAEL